MRTNRVRYSLESGGDCLYALRLISYLMRVCIGIRHHGERNCSTAEQKVRQFVVLLSESEVERSVTVVATLVHCYAWI